MQKDYGKIAVTPGGAWNGETDYEKLVEVTRLGSSYISKVANKNVPPETDVDPVTGVGTYWQRSGTKGDKGNTGEQGPAATVRVGTVTTGEPGTNASVVNSGTTGAAVLDFTIPKGDKGDKGDTGNTGQTGPQGPAATINVGSVTTGEPGTQAAVTNSGTQQAAVFDFVIPQGEKGDKGNTGNTGATGAAATITVGSTTTGEPGTNASVVNSGTTCAAVLDFTIPKGDKGEPGDVSTEQLNAAVAALQEKLENGVVIPAVANDIASWKNTNSKVVDTQTAPVFTAGGNESVNSNENARIISLSPNSLTAGAASLVSTGFNLLRNATQIGSGQVWYFLVPYLKFGTFGTADENNGVLFTGSDNGKLTPTVYWKALSDGVPTSATDGVAAGYTDSNGYRFFTTPAGHEGEVGYFIVQATRATTCAHVAWSGRYDEYIAVDNAGDAGASLALTSILNNLHSNGLMYNIGLVADSVSFTATTAYWTKNCDRKQGSDLTWTNTLQEDNETYLHTATIADMLDDSVVVCTNENISLVVSGKEVSYTDTNEAAITTDYIYYQLATAETGTVAGTYSFVIEDWGVIYFTGVNGTVVSIIEYSQNIVDTLRKLATTGFNDAMRVIAESLNQLAAENVRLKTYAERLEARIEALES